MFGRKKQKSDPKELWEDFFKSSLKQDWVKARPTLENIIALEPRNTQAHLKMGDLLQKTGDAKGAVASYHRSANILEHAGFGHKALALYKIVLRLDPKDERAAERTEAILQSRKHKAEPDVASEPAPTPEAEPDAHVAEPATPMVEGPQTPGFETPGDEETRPDDAMPGSGELPPLDETGYAPPPESKDDLPSLDGWGMDEEAGTETSEEAALSFCSLGAEEAEEILSEAALETYSDGETVVEEGAGGDSIYVIKKGAAKVVAHFGPNTVELALLKRGDVFGEVAFITGRPRTASVIARGTLEVLDISREVLQEAINKKPEILDRLAEYYYGRVHDTLEKVKAASQGPK